MKPKKKKVFVFQKDFLKDIICADLMSGPEGLCSPQAHDVFRLFPRKHECGGDVSVWERACARESQVLLSGLGSVTAPPLLL